MRRLPNSICCKQSYYFLEQLFSLKKRLLGHFLRTNVYFFGGLGRSTTRNIPASREKKKQRKNQRIVPRFFLLANKYPRQPGTNPHSGALKCTQIPAQSIINKQIKQLSKSIRYCVCFRWAFMKLLFIISYCFSRNNKCSLYFILY